MGCVTEENSTFIPSLTIIGGGPGGYEAAMVAAKLGARVTLVAAAMTAQPPSGVELVRVVSTADLAREMERLAPQAYMVVMAAAPADFTPEQASDSKIKKDGDGARH